MISEQPVAQCAPCNISAPCQTQSARSKHSSARLGGISFDGFWTIQPNSRFVHLDIHVSPIARPTCDFFFLIFRYIRFFPFYFSTVYYLNFWELAIILDYRIGVILEKIWNFECIFYTLIACMQYLLLLFFFFEIKRERVNLFVAKWKMR